MKKLLLISCIFGMLSCSNFDFDPKKDSQVLKDICRELPSPPKTNKLEEVSTMRSHAGVFSIYYSHESSCNNVVNYYEKTLKKRKWERIPSSFFNPPDIINFRKGEISISLSCKDIRSLWGKKKFSIECSKGLQ